MKKTMKFALVATLFSFASVAAHAAEIDCVKLSFAIKQEVAANHSMVLQIVEKAVLANPGCACEIVKASISETQADVKMVAAIVEVAAKAAPEQMRVIAQCAVAVAPDSLAEVQLVLAKLDPGTGVKPAAPQNVLDFPTNGENVAMGPNAGEAAYGSMSGAMGSISGTGFFQPRVIIKRKAPPATFSRLSNRP